MNLHNNWSILLWRPATLLTWMVVAEGPAHVLTNRSVTGMWDGLPPHEASASTKFPCKSIDDNEYPRGGGDHLSKAGPPPSPSSATNSSDRLRLSSSWETHNPAGGPPTGSIVRKSGLRHHLRLLHPNRARQPARMKPPVWHQCRPHSIRGQITVLAGVMVALTLVTAGAGMYSMTQPGTTRSRNGLHQAALVTDDVHPGPAAGHSGPRVRDVRLAGITAPGLADFGRPDPLQLIMALECAGLIALAMWVTWKTTGKLLRPVEVVSAELAMVDLSALPARTSEPRNAREITRLCHSINNLLERLHETKQEIEEIGDRRRQSVSDLAHELRNPIAGLRVQLEEAQKDPGRVQLPELLSTTLNQVNRLQAIIDDILFLARMKTCPPTERQQLDLAVLVQIEIAQRSDRHRVGLQLTHGTTVTAVPSQIRRLLANLLDNAQRHSRHFVCVEVCATHAIVELAVSDDGPGIAEADRERVFHRFTRLDDARRLDHNGTGLGLAIARDIAHAHHGTLSAEESTTGGSRFILRLPHVRPGEMGSL
ncbi:Signal transduction histidine kinase [Streptosporangium subroseum]|uniref:histidine kinase n=1 Tax=Streptosporangium subroseum TaxID=106412 RepID=A0A239B078_9ACTN|nr:HAMP domain-containing sensor histidine kinase [Streptosporangium subroseum]SNS01021.1 Signal transduction histidine kinase [Streptosporangium subroseum]